MLTINDYYFKEEKQQLKLNDWIVIKGLRDWLGGFFLFFVSSSPSSHSTSLTYLEHTLF